MTTLTDNPVHTASVKARTMAHTHSTGQDLVGCLRRTTEIVKIVESN